MQVLLLSLLAGLAARASALSTVGALPRAQLALPRRPVLGAAPRRSLASMAEDAPAAPEEANGPAAAAAAAPAAGNGLARRLRQGLGSSISRLVPRAVPRPVKWAGGALLGAIVLSRLVHHLWPGGSAVIGSVPLVGRVLYNAQQFLIQRAGLAVLAFAGASTALGGVLFKAVESSDETLEDATFRAYSLLNNVPGADAVEVETPLGKVVANALYMTGVLTFAILIGIVSDNISGRVEGLRVSNERVLEVRAKNSRYPGEACISADTSLILARRCGTRCSATGASTPSRCSGSWRRRGARGGSRAPW